MIKKQALGWAIVLLLTGCAQSIDGWQVLAAQKFCERHEGIDYFGTVITVYVVCRDGRIYRPEMTGNKNDN